MIGSHLPITQNTLGWWARERWANGQSNSMDEAINRGKYGLPCGWNENGFPYFFLDQCQPPFYTFKLNCWSTLFLQKWQIEISTIIKNGKELNIPHHFSQRIVLLLGDSQEQTISPAAWIEFLCHLSWWSLHL